MPKLHSKEKTFLQDIIEKACIGTPLQDNAEFAGGYLGNLIATYMENWEVIRRGLGLPSLIERDKAVINDAYGSFQLSQEAFEAYHALRELPLPKDRHKAGDAVSYWSQETNRTDPYLVQVVEALGEQANGPGTKAKVVKVKWIHEMGHEKELVRALVLEDSH